MKVYLATVGGHDGVSIIGIYSDEIKALKEVITYLELDGEEIHEKSKITNQEYTTYNLRGSSDKVVIRKMNVQ